MDEEQQAQGYDSNSSFSQNCINIYTDDFMSSLNEYLGGVYKEWNTNKQELRPDITEHLPHYGEDQVKRSYETLLKTVKVVLKGEGAY